MKFPATTRVCVSKIACSFSHESEGDLKKGKTYLCEDIFERRRADEGETDEKDVCLRIRERTEAVIVFLTRCIPEPEIDGCPVDRDVGCVIVESKVDRQ